MIPPGAFVFCWGVYRSARAYVREMAGIAEPMLSNVQRGPNGQFWKPDLKLRFPDWILDFTRATQAPFLEPDKGLQLIVVDRYYLREHGAERVMRDLGLPYHKFAALLREISETAGVELERRGLYPPEAYFRHRGPREEKTR